MKSIRLIGRALVASALLTLVGCVSMPKQQAFNREANASVKNITVLETMPSRTSVFMMHHPGMNFGLIGGLVAAADQAAKEKRFNALLEKEKFDAIGYFRERLGVHLTDKGYTLTWPSAAVEASKNPRGAFGLRKGYGPVATDAQLDVNFGFVGYAAAGASDRTPYRPTVSVGVRMVGADGKQNLFTDYVLYNNVFNLQKAVSLNPDEGFAYPDFDDLEAAGPQAVEGLKLAIDSVAAAVAQQL